MSEQNRTAPRWEDARDHTLKLLREERDSIAAELPQVENVDERELFDAWLARVDLAITTIGAIDDAALARLAEPTTAAERWRAVPAEERADLADALGDVLVPPRLLLALDALLALAREAEGGGA